MSIPESLVGKSGRCTGCRERFVARRPPPQSWRMARAPVDDGNPFLETDIDDDRIVDVEDDLEIIDDEVDDSHVLEEDNGPFRIAVDPGFPDVPQDVLDEVAEAIRHRLTAAPEGTFRESDLSLSIDRYDPGSQFMRYMFPFLAGAARVALSITGSVNGQPVNASSRAACYMGFFGGDSQKMLEICLQDCLIKILLAIDAAAGRAQTPFARFWNRLRIACWVLAAMAAVTYAAVFAAVRLPNPGRNGAGGEVGLIIMGSVFMAVSCLGIVTLGPLLFAPREFLLNDPRGMKLMSRAGTRIPAMMKVVTAFLLFVSCGGILLALSLLMGQR